MDRNGNGNPFRSAFLASSAHFLFAKRACVERSFFSFTSFHAHMAGRESVEPKAVLLFLNSRLTQKALFVHVCESKNQISRFFSPALRVSEGKILSEAADKLGSRRNHKGKSECARIMENQILRITKHLESALRRRKAQRGRRVPARRAWQAEIPQQHKSASCGNENNNFALFRAEPAVSLKLFSSQVDTEAEVIPVTSAVGFRQSQIGQSWREARGKN